ncbi:hypothetical protein BDV18DRAFT_160610 [Aspergillus unguis]
MGAMKGTRVSVSVNLFAKTGREIQDVVAPTIVRAVSSHQLVHNVPQVGQSQAGCVDVGRLDCAAALDAILESVSVDRERYFSPRMTYKI